MPKHKKKPKKSKKHIKAKNPKQSNSARPPKKYTFDSSAAEMTPLRKLKAKAQSGKSFSYAASNFDILNLFDNWYHNCSSLNLSHFKLSGLIQNPLWLYLCAYLFKKSKTIDISGCNGAATELPQGSKVLPNTKGIYAQSTKVNLATNFFETTCLSHLRIQADSIAKFIINNPGAFPPQRENKPLLIIEISNWGEASQASQMRIIDAMLIACQQRYPSENSQKAVLRHFKDIRIFNHQRKNSRPIADYMSPDSPIADLQHTVDVAGQSYQQRGGVRAMSVPKLCLLGFSLACNPAPLQRFRPQAVMHHLGRRAGAPPARTLRRLCRP